MNIKECPEIYKIYNLNLSNGKKIVITGEQKKKIFYGSNNLVELENGQGFNKSFIINWEIDMEATRLNVQKNAGKIKNSLSIYE